MEGRDTSKHEEKQHTWPEHLAHLHSLLSKSYGHSDRNGADTELVIYTLASNLGLIQHTEDYVPETELQILMSAISPAFSDLICLSIDKITDAILDKAKHRNTPILVRRGNEFLIYGRLKSGRWEYTELMGYLAHQQLTDEQFTLLETLDYNSEQVIKRENLGSEVQQIIRGSHSNEMTDEKAWHFAAYEIIVLSDLILLRNEWDADSPDGQAHLQQVMDAITSIPFIKCCLNESKESPTLCYLHDHIAHKAFSHFYHEHSIIKETNIDQRNLRIMICTLTANVICSAFGLLGINVPERM